MEKKTALVTGANRGIGYETCRQLASLGMRVILTSRDEGRGKEAANQLAESGMDIRFEQLDVSSDVSVEKCAERLGEASIAVNVLINNAAVYPSGGLLDGPQTLAFAMNVNFWGPVRVTRAFVPGMISTGYGRIVNVSSGCGSFGEHLDGPDTYSISKAALNACTVKLSRHLRGDLKVNAVCPGWVRTEMGGSGAPRSVEEGASGIVWAATLPADGPTGGFFRDGKPIEW